MSVSRRTISEAPLPSALPPTLEQRVVATGLELRAAAADDEHPTGLFSGWAVLFDTVDAYGTTFAPGSFDAGGLDRELYALLAMHDPEQVIGVFTAEERMGFDDGTGKGERDGVWIDGGWDPTPEGQAARARARSGSAPELSVGFVPMMLDPDNDTRFTQVRLVETSQITRRMAAVPGAGFAAARHALPRGAVGAEPETLADAKLLERRRAAAAMLELAVPVRTL